MTLPKGSGAFASKIAADRTGTGTDNSAAEAVDVEAWASEFGVSSSQISEAVAAVGANKSDVANYLKN